MKENNNLPNQYGDFRTEEEKSKEWVSGQCLVEKIIQDQIKRLGSSSGAHVVCNCPRCKARRPRM